MEFFKKWWNVALKSALAVTGFIWVARYFFSFRDILEGDTDFVMLCLMCGPLVLGSIFMGGEIREILRVLVFYAEFFVRGLQFGFFVMGGRVIIEWFSNPDETRCEPLFVAITVGLACLEWCRIRWRKLDNSIWTRSASWNQTEAVG
jgi:hypothetical protein